MKLSRLVAASAAAAALSASVAVSAKIENDKGSSKNAEIPTCGRSLGTIALVDGDGQGWKAYQLGAPSTLLKTFISKSGCFKLVNRGAGMEAIRREQALSGGGDLQRGSNVGGGQIRAADWLLVAADAAAAAPRQAFIARTSVDMKRSPSPSSSRVRTLESGMMVYPLGAREGMWWEVEDENGNAGWVLNDKLAPKK